jgi:hypothetical protein
VRSREASASDEAGAGAWICTLPLIPVQRLHSTQAKQEATTNFATSSTPETHHHPFTTATHTANPRTFTLRICLSPTVYTRSIAHNTRTMVARLAALLLSGVALLQVQAQAIAAPDLVGTWTSKSNGTVTGDVRIIYTTAEKIRS